MPSLLQRTRPPRTHIQRAVIQNPWLAVRELNNRSYHRFLKFFWPEVSGETFQDNWHIQKVCEELQTLAENVAAGRPRPYDVYINVPPGTSKTTTCSIMFPAWCWTRWHWMKFITLSYSAALSLETAEYARELIRSDRFRLIYPDLSIKQDKDQKGNYQVTKMLPQRSLSGPAPRSRGGNRYSTSVGGTLTGFHAHIIIVDDPINPEQAVSDVELRAANRWLTNTLPTRKIDKSVTPTIYIMQRLHEDDPTGHQLAKGKKNIRHICLPGEIRNYRDRVKPEEWLKYYSPDGLLDPKRLGWAVLEDLEADLGQYGYAGQIGQSPTPPAGGMFNPDLMPIRDRTPDPSELELVVRYWDKAATKAKPGESSHAKYTAGVKMGRYRGGERWIVLDVVRGRWDSGTREQIIRTTAEADGQDVHVWVEQEPGSGGKESAEATIRRLAGFRASAECPKGDKVYRADPYSVQVKYGNVELLRGEWNHDFKEEHRHFPHSTYKDQVDAAGGAFAKLTSRKLARILGRNRTGR